MAANKDEALKCLAIAQKYRDSGNFSSARKFAEKSIALFSTPEGIKLLQSIKDAAESSSSAAGTSASSSATETHPSASTTRHRTGHESTSSGSQKKRDYTEENVAIVKRVRSCKITDYYGILGLAKDCEEGDVKKAYRKLALQLHPDKNGAPGADEAFKMVSKAFQVLSDADKRAAFDRHGSDPESRSSGMASRGGFSHGPTFEGELSPEDLFNMFFGGGGGFAGPGFGGGPVFTASFGPGGFRTTRVRTNAGAGGAAQPDNRSVFVQLLPLLILFAFSLLSALPNIFSSAGPPDPDFAFAKTAYFSQERLTSPLNIPYFVNPPQFSKHAIYESIPVDMRGPEVKKAGGSSSKLDAFEAEVERVFKSRLLSACQREAERKERRIESKQGFFGIGADWDAINKIRSERIESCEQLREWGVIR